MRALLIAIAFVAGLALGAGLLHRRFRDLPREHALVELLRSKAAVERTFGRMQSDLLRQLESFAQLLSADRDFAMKLLIEQDRSSPDISQFAVRYLPAMGLSLLEVADSDGVLLSSGHFPASAGNSVADKLAFLDAKAVCVDDMIQGQAALTLQARVETMLGDIARISCSGGWVIDEAFLATLTPHTHVTLLLRHGERFLGLDSAATVSTLIDNRMTIDGVTYLATALTLPYHGELAAPELIILSTCPPALSLF